MTWTVIDTVYWVGVAAGLFSGILATAGFFLLVVPAFTREKRADE